jgi:hypothetical protein
MTPKESTSFSRNAGAPEAQALRENYLKRESRPAKSRRMKEWRASPVLESRAQGPTHA